MRKKTPNEIQRKRINKSQRKRIDKSIQFLRDASALFETLPRHERCADLNFLIDKYVNNPSEELRRRDREYEQRMRDAHEGL